MLFYASTQRFSIVSIQKCESGSVYEALKGDYSGEIKWCNSCLVCSRNAELRIIFLSWKDICATKSLFWSDKTEMWWDLYHYLLIIWEKNLFGHNVWPKLRFRRTWADLSRTLSNDRQLFAALEMCFKVINAVLNTDSVHEKWISDWSYPGCLAVLSLDLVSSAALGGWNVNSDKYSNYQHKLSLHVVLKT